MDKNKAIFLVGNYGVGKSTIINEPILKSEGIFLMIKDNLYVLGSSISGADSLSNWSKEKVFEEIIKNKTKNIIITGNYYCQIKDIKLLSSHFNVVLIYLKTSFENNVKRILKRGKLININTYNAKLKSHISMINNTKGYRKLFVIDNNQDIDIVKKEFYKIIEGI
jgi:dephospho-CoA kinase